MKKLFLSLLLVLICTATVFALPDPQKEVAKMVDSVLEVLKRTDLDVAQKKAMVSGRVQKFLNIQSMAERTLGPYWAGATAEQRQQFSDLFLKVLEGTYLNRIDDYSNGTVKYLMQRVKDDKAIVDTSIVQKDLEIPVQYKMIYENGSWQVFDLVIEGVSLIRNYRSSYGEIIRRDGYEGLLALMQKKVAEMEGRKSVQ
ncbi:MlaC/ttg2D family ABC transporter substrate-binding protein [Pelobacter seleniigenes]|uniref:MlaC/ttg2D family ABC transporter substrate-binding protein n=1 Tax=Pelobacter seleniigenes TaxID=407188 RepID=UPI0004A7348A|nr:ABC transporter substrate-binding protein [Pelobacter seleniigenes]